MSAATALIAAKRTANLVAPEITGTMKVGETLTTSKGYWKSSVTLSYTYVWQRCDEDDSNCSTISGETGSTYVVSVDDLASTLRTIVTTTTYCGCSVSATSSTTNVIGFLEYPGDIVISGTAELGQTLIASTTPTWALPGDVALTYRWQRCNATGLSCTDLSATGTNYVLTGSDVTHTMRVTGTATWPLGSINGNSDATAVVSVGAPTNSVLPVISGSLVDGTSMTSTNGTWSGTQQYPTTLTRQWQRCVVATTTCVDIASATGTSYTLVPADVGSAVRIAVTGTSAGGATTVYSLVSAVVTLSPPVNSVLPTISGAAKEGATLTAGNGTWTGLDPKTYTYQWALCDNTGNNCVDIGGETSSTYIVLVTDVGSTVMLEVTATNADGSAAATSAATAVITASIPFISIDPEITGLTDFGSTLTVSDGSWGGTAPITYAYQWNRCSGGICAPIIGETNNTYVLTLTDVDNTISADVIATNVEGSTTATSAEVGPVTHFVAPDNLILPRVIGETVEDQILTVDNGSWYAIPDPEFTYQWLRCDNVGTIGTCVDIAGETSGSYELATADVGVTVRVEVTGTNPAGFDVATSQESAVIDAAPPTFPPTNDVLPTISGLMMESQELTVSTGTWSGTPTIDYAVQWQRCDTDGTNCNDLAAITGMSYVADVTDIGFGLRVKVTATNADGTDVAYSALTDTIVSQQAPTNLVLPEITGALQIGSSLSLVYGTWFGTPTINYGVRWTRCDAAGDNCVDVVGAVFDSYTLTLADVNSTLRVEVTAANYLGESTVASEPTLPINNYIAPFYGVAPSISGAAIDGATLTGDNGEWGGDPDPTYTVKWERCDLAGDNCIDIMAAIGSTYTLTASDVGQTLRYTVTATNPGGSVSVSSVQSSEVEPNVPPTIIGQPHITGTAVDTQTLSTTSGVWYGIPSSETTLQWLSCDAVGNNCVEIVGATEPTFTLESDQIGNTLRVRSDAFSIAGTASSTSEESPVVQAWAVPVNTITPVLSGQTWAGGAMSVDTGTWTGTDPITYSYQWRRCDNVGDNCVDIVSGTNATYTVTNNDTGSSLRAVVTANNIAGSTSDTTQESRVICNCPPGIIGDPPILSGSAEETQVMTVDSGIISGASAIDYRWMRCDAAGDNCVDIVGETQTSYTVQTIDIGSTLRVEVSASNPYGTYSQTTDASAVVIAMSAPSNTVLPAVAGETVWKKLLTAETGTWIGTASITFTYRWQECDAAGLNCVNLTGETDPNYTINGSNIGNTMRVIVTARNVAGIVSATSVESAVITAS